MNENPYHNEPGFESVSLIAQFSLEHFGNRTSMVVSQGWNILLIVLSSSFYELLVSV